VIEDYGLVQREMCACRGVIITATNASPDRIVEAVTRHVGTPEHRAYSEALAFAYDTSPEVPLASPAAGAMTRGDSRRAEVEDSSVGTGGRSETRPPSPGGTPTPIFSADGYDFWMPRYPSPTRRTRDD